MKFTGIFSKNFKHTLDGYVFENEDREIVASVNIGYGIFHWEVAMVATHPDYRRRGLARQLVTAAINHAKELGAKLIVLEVLDINEPAYKLYRKQLCLQILSNLARRVEVGELLHSTREGGSIFTCSNFSTGLYRKVRIRR
jgi:ribosomal protein S18 acetylase RimI-like enzyme